MKRQDSAVAIPEIRPGQSIELRERLAEAQRWRYAFQTLAANGKVIGICFEDHSAGRNEAEISRAFNEFQFPEKTRAVFSANLKH